jgi:hypothetical protein
MFSNKKSSKKWRHDILSTKRFAKVQTFDLTTERLQQEKTWAEFLTIEIVAVTYMH